jgi:hypothetical protein
MDIPAPFRIDGEKRLVFKQGGGCLSVFGLPFLGAGIFLLLIFAGVIPLQNANVIGGWERVGMLFMGIAFTVAGSSLVFGRKLLAIDLPRGIISETWCFFAPVKSNTARLRDFHLVTLRFSEGNSDSPDRYPLALEDKNGKNCFKIFSPAEYGAACNLAHALADYLSFPFEEHVSATTTVYDPHKTEETIQTPPEAPQAAPARPATMRSTVKTMKDGLEIFIPYPAFLPIVVFIVIVMVFIFSNFFPSFRSFKNIRFDKTSDVFELIFFGAFFLFFLFPLLRLFLAFTRRKSFGWTIKVVSGCLTLEEKTPGRPKLRTFSAAEVLSIDYAGPSSDARLRDIIKPSQGQNPFAPGAASSGSSAGNKVLAALALRSNHLVLKTQNDIVAFGQGLSREEAVYLCALITQRLKV